MGPLQADVVGQRVVLIHGGAETDPQGEAAGPGRRCHHSGVVHIHHHFGDDEFSPGFRKKFRLLKIAFPKTLACGYAGRVKRRHGRHGSGDADFRAHGVPRLQGEAHR